MYFATGSSLDLTSGSFRQIEAENLASQSSGFRGEVFGCVFSLSTVMALVLNQCEPALPPCNYTNLGIHAVCTLSSLYICPSSPEVVPHCPDSSILAACRNMVLPTLHDSAQALCARESNSPPTTAITSYER